MNFLRLDEVCKLPETFLRVGLEVVIIGYPFGMSEDNPYPIWKRAWFASEPSITIGGMPKIYLDSPGRPGMSGSPIFRIDRGIGVSRELYEANERFEETGEISKDHLALILNTPRHNNEINVLEFVGIYSGFIGDRKLNALNLGIAWHAAALDMLFRQPFPGTNPFPPEPS